MNIIPTPLDNAVSYYINQNTYTHIENYKDIFGYYESLKENYKVVMNNIGRKLSTTLINNNLITYKISGNKKLLSLYSIARYQLHKELLSQYFIEIKDALKLMGYTSNLTTFSHIHRFKYLHQNNYLQLIILDHPIDKQKYFINRDELKMFLEENINLVQAAEIFKIDINTLRQYWLNKYKKPIIVFHQSDPLFCYVNKKEWNKFSKEKFKEGVLSRSNSANFLGITIDNFNKVVSEYKLKPEKFNSNIESASYFKQVDLERLKAKQESMLKEIIEKYYTSQQAIKILGISESTFSNKIYTSRIKTKLPPPLVCTSSENINLRRSGKFKLYDIEDIYKIKLELDAKRMYEDVLYKLNDTPINIFKKIIEVTQTSFPLIAAETKHYWFNYVNNKLTKSKASDTTSRKEIQLLLSTTQLLTKVTQQKELFQFTSKEITFSIFNSEVSIMVKQEIYKFLNKLAESKSNIIISYKFSSLPNPYKLKKELKSEKNIYTINEYISLIDFINNLSLHKKNAIEDVYQQLEKQKSIKNNKSRQYDSVWLYVLLHLNNAWRHSDVTLFPRISLKDTRLNSMDPLAAIKWLITNNLNSKEIESIVNQAKAFTLIHSKTKKKRYFFCSDELKSTFAHASVICELRTNLTKPLSNTIIDLDNRKRTLKERQEKYFFNNFHTGFVFKSKQMNRTVISYIYSVIKKITNRNPLEITKFIRSHSNEETTNYYIDIPQNQMDFITKQLFDLGHFGYAYDTLTQLLTGEIPEDRSKRTNTALLMRETFGEVYQIESTANYLNRISQDKEFVKKYLMNLDHTQRENLTISIKLGQTPSKKDGYQCILRKCHYPERDCGKCHFSVPSFYCLSEISTELDAFLDLYQKRFAETSKKGEKIFLANKLYSYLYLIKQAISKYGAESVSFFFPGGLSALKKRLSDVESTKHLITVPEWR
ncbi:MAG: hypothetical protein ACQEV7_06955 [Bacillota bacterium]